MSFYMPAPDRKKLIQNKNQTTFKSQRHRQSSSTRRNGNGATKKRPIKNTSTTTRNDGGVLIPKKQKPWIPIEPTKNPAKPKCHFCQSRNAALVVKGLVEKPLCLLHYYTTRHCRQDAKKVTRLEKEVRRQLPDVQTLFSEVFLELRDEIAKEGVGREVAASYANEDPLAALIGEGRRSAKTAKVEMASSSEGGKKRGTRTKLSLSTIPTDPLGTALRGIGSVSTPATIMTSRKPHKKRKVPTSIAARSSAAAVEAWDPLGAALNGTESRSRPTKSLPSHRVVSRNDDDDDEGGGFIKEDDSPEKVRRHEEFQKRQVERGAAEARREVDAAARRCINDDTEYNPYKRLKSSNRHYWDLGGGDETAAIRGAAASDWGMIEAAMGGSYVCSSCGSNNVQADCNITGRNDIAKGETW
eukprot:CAMPEP_0172524458 /NCGR_PEP_ID=MMETSP1066-20121228/294201_1 /TAXON_ID=671091 /ORGANISM="Coscinodiscus wailesii, Strain CCMP2513" /LENGTH=413 /DNA_ID=CAMNT_0013307593 /DNA_START=96 /DNA_END=1334 /DNA_ORIENTATION=-